MTEPLRQIVANAGEESSVILDKVSRGKGNYGYDAAKGEYTDMIKAGILDPTKVVRTAAQAGTRGRFGRRPRSARVKPWRVQNAASIAGLHMSSTWAPPKPWWRRCRRRTSRCRAAAAWVT